MDHNYEFWFGKIILKPLEHQDIESLRVLRNREKQYFSTQMEINGEGQEQWFRNYLKKDNDIMFKIVKREDPNTFIGAIALYDIDWVGLTSECGRTVIDKSAAPEKGLGLEATKAVCLFGFDDLKLKKIVGVVLKSNERIIKVDTRAGFLIVNERGNMYDIEMTRESINL